MDYYEYIEDYCEGLLDETNSKAFEGAMQRDKNLAELVEQYPIAKKISEGLLEMDVLGVIDSLKKPQSKKRQLDIKKKVSIWRYVAAALVLVGLAVGAWLLQNNPVDRHEYFVENYVYPIDEEATRSVDTVGMNGFQKGKYYFALNDFEQSEILFLDLIKSNKGDRITSEAYYWLGHVYMNMNKWKDATEAFNQTKRNIAKENGICKEMSK